MRQIRFSTTEIVSFLSNCVIYHLKFECYCTFFRDQNCSTKKGLKCNFPLQTKHETDSLWIHKTW